MQFKRIFHYLWENQPLRAPLTALGVLVLLTLVAAIQDSTELLMYLLLNQGVV
jgi:hypothetical protein